MLFGEAKGTSKIESFCQCVLSVSLCAYAMWGACRDKGIGTELQVVRSYSAWVLGTRLMSSGWSASTLKSQTISLSLRVFTKGHWALDDLSAFKKWWSILVADAEWLQRMEDKNHACPEHDGGGDAASGRFVRSDVGDGDAGVILRNRLCGRNFN